LGTESDNLASDFHTASLVRAVVDTEAEIGVLAQAGSIGVRASEISSLCEHVANAHLTTRRQTGRIGLSQNHRSKDTDSDEGLHIDD
jgi:hypothetical protein